MSSTDKVDALLIELDDIRFKIRTGRVLNPDGLLHAVIAEHFQRWAGEIGLLSSAHAKRILQDWIQDDEQVELIRSAWPDLAEAHSALAAIASSTTPPEPKPAQDKIHKIIEALNIAEQALREVQHAQSVGSNWYTRGAPGLYQQVAMWIRKGFAAISEAKLFLEPPK